MTTVTIVIDDPNGLNSNLLFPGGFPSYFLSANTAPTEAVMRFQHYAGDVVDNTVTYNLRATGNAFTPVPVTFDTTGYVNALTLTRQLGGGTAVQIMHADFALDGLWTATGGVGIASLAGLTIDVLVNAVRLHTPINLSIVGNVGNDVLNGSFYNDTLRGSAGADLLLGGAGTDAASYVGSNLGVTINLATGAASGGHAAGDRLSSIEDVVGSSFNDILTGNPAANLLDGGLGFDTINGGAGNDFIFGRDGGGNLRGGVGNDRIDGGAQNDLIYGGSGNDELRVGDGTNTAYGEGGNDFLLGYLGLDRFFGGAGNDILDGSGGNDLLDGGTGQDQMFGYAGINTFYVDNVLDRVFEFGSTESDLVMSSISFNLTPSAAITGNVERLTLTGTANIVGFGNALNNVITGNVGANKLSGADGADRILGKSGGDTITGGRGNDILTGGAGFDSFIFHTPLGAANIDAITDFKAAFDTIRLDNAIFTALGTGPLQAARFWKSPSGLAHDANDRILYETDTGNLYYDSNGNAAGGRVQFATLTGHPAIGAADFFVI